MNELTCGCRNGHTWKTEKDFVKDFWAPKQRTCPTCGHVYLTCKQEEPKS